MSCLGTAAGDQTKALITCGSNDAGCMVGAPIYRIPSGLGPEEASERRISAAEKVLLRRQQWAKSSRRRYWEKKRVSNLNNASEKDE